MIVLSIEGDPVSWKAHGGYGRKSFNHRYKEKEYTQWQLKKQYNGPLFDDQIRVDLTFYVAIPKGVSKKKREDMISGVIRPKKRPDRGNYLKFYEDCLTGIVIKDDSIIVEGDPKKWYSDHPKTVITIKRV